MSVEQWGSLFFSFAVLHTFLVGPIRSFGHRFPKESFRADILHLLGEIEIVFGFWAALFLGFLAWREGGRHAVAYLDSLSFTEPLFVFAIMAVAATRPILEWARRGLQIISQTLQAMTGAPTLLVEVFVLLSFGPLAGSFITEPAAMTVTALLFVRMIEKPAKGWMSALLAFLFVNVSIGGALTPFAAPPILMVAKTWGWDLTYTLTHLGWKAAVAVILNALLFVVIFRKDLHQGMVSLKKIEEGRASQRGAEGQIPWGLGLVHVLFLVSVVLAAHHEKLFLGIFLFFLGVVSVTRKFQAPVRLKESLLVAFFLAGIVVFGPMQTWWLRPLLENLSDLSLFLGATVLTGVVDNAALTYLGAQVEGLSEMSRYALVAGALAGGGLTIIANAPNPAGFSILQHQFPEGKVNPFLLLKAALLPTLIAGLCFWFLPRF